MNNNLTMRKVLFTAKDNSVIRTKLNLSGSSLCPPSTLVFNGKVYYHLGSGMQYIFYREMEDTYMIIEDL